MTAGIWLSLFTLKVENVILEYIRTKLLLSYLAQFTYTLATLPGMRHENTGMDDLTV
jgi:hypothetical protein